MLIGLWSAEPQQIKSSERIMAWADIKPLPHPQTRTSSQEERGVVKERGKHWEEVSRGQDVIMTVFVYVWQGSKRRDEEKTNMQEKKRATQTRKRNWLFLLPLLILNDFPIVAW